MYSVIGTDGQVYGPATMDTLASWCREGRITAETNLIDPIDGRVLKARQVPLLEPHIAALSPSAPPIANSTAQAPISTSSVHPTSGHQFGQVPIQINNYVSPTPVHVHSQSVGDKTKAAAIVLAFFFGALGAHRFYLGYGGSGVAMLLITVLTCGWGAIVTGIWAIIDIINIATGSMTDARGHALQ